MTTRSCPTGGRKPGASAAVCTTMASDDRHPDTQWALALRTAGIAMWTLDLTSGAIDARGAFCEALASPLTLHDVLAHWETSGATADVERGQAMADAIRVAPDGERFEMEHRLRRPDGTARWVLSRGTVRLTGDRRLLIGSTIDIDDLRGTREALRGSDRRLRASLRAVGGYIVEWNPADDTVVFIESADGAVRDPMTLAAALDQVYPDDRDAVRAALRSVQLSGSPSLLDLRTSHGTSGYRRRLAHIAMSTGDGAPLLSALVVDAGDLRVFTGPDGLVAPGSVELDRIAELSREALLAFDADGRITFVTAPGAHLLGYTPGELIGRRWSDLCLPMDQPVIEAGLARRARGGHDRWEFRARRKDGGVLWLEDTGAVLTDGTGREISRVSIWTDVTERREREDALNDRVRAKDALLREVHHRVRNNFQVVSSLLNLQFHGADAASLPGRIRDMQNRVGTIALLHSLLYEAADPSVADAGRYLRRLIDSISQSFEDVRGRVSVDLEADEVALPTDAGLRLGLILNELLTNALKHAFVDGRRGHVHVTLRGRGATAVDLEVRDDGVGFAAGGTLPADGTTLGLPLVGDLAQQLGGRLRITAAPGAGAVIRVDCPLAPSPEVARNG
ncbi:MAG: PAS domain-containing protein [Vicinamibacterales bacterium]